jgi:hypothetical protein
MQDKVKEIERQYKIEVDNYNTTINVIVCFSHAVLWDEKKRDLFPDSSFTPGRRMDTSENNPISPNTTVTPDIAILKEKKHGVIAEIKQGLSRGNGNWEKVLSQLEKYDDDLKGWRGMDADDVLHDLVLLIPYQFSVQFSSFLAECVAEDKYRFARKLACISFVREDKASTFYNFQKVYGELTDEEKDRLFYEIHAIPMQRVCPLYPLIFCDEEPPVPYTMDRIWGHLASYKTDDLLSSKKGEEIYFTLASITEDLKRENCIDTPDDRTPELPRTSWVREALNEMKSLKILNWDKDTGEYSVGYHKYDRMKNPIDFFIRKLAERDVQEEQARSNQQLELPI